MYTQDSYYIQNLLLVQHVRTLISQLLLTWHIVETVEHYEV